MDDEDIAIMKLEPSAEHLRKILQQRLDSLHSELGLEKGTLLQIDDLGYSEINSLTRSSPGLALELMRRLRPSSQEIQACIDAKKPYIITKQDVDKLNLSYDVLIEYWDSPARDFIIMRLKP